MKKYHFSAKFKGSSWSYHGEFITGYTDLDIIKKFAKKTLAEKLPNWKKQEIDLTEFEIYNNDRTVIFNWKK